MTTAVRLRRRKGKRVSPHSDPPILNSADKAVIATDLSGKVVFWNLMAEEIYGWKWNEVIGRPITDLVVPPSAQSDGEKIMEQLRQGKSWTGEFRLRRRDGSEFIGKVTDEPMRDSKGNLIGIIGISHASSARPRKRNRQPNDAKS